MALRLIANLFFLERECSRSDLSEDTRAEIIATHGQTFVGGFYLLVSKMRKEGYRGDAAKLRQILKIAVEQNFADPAVRDAICEKHRQLSDWLRQRHENWHREDALRSVYARHR